MAEYPSTASGSEPTRWHPGRIERAARRLAAWPLDRRLAWALDRFTPGLCLATSFGPQSIVAMHAIVALGRRAPMFYLDTGLLFAETYRLRDRLERRLNVRFERVGARLTLGDQSNLFGPRLWSHDPDRCCWLRKVVPLRGYLASKRAWITGIRRQHTPDRATAGLIEWDGANGLVKLNPLADWSKDRVWDYIREHDLPFNPLHDRGYPSLGCRPCTRRPKPGEDPRAGRWAGFAKTECGIHGRARAATIPLTDATEESSR